VRGYDHRVVRCRPRVRELAVLALVVFAARPGGASANGRPSATSSISFRQGHETDIAAGMTFGLLISRDAGVSWQWVCEEAIGYSPVSVYDPHYAFTPSGALFATTYNGFRVERDFCTFAAATPTAAFASTTALAGDGTLYYASSQAADPYYGVAADFRIYRSTNDGASFEPTAGQPAGTVGWWQTLAVARSNTNVIYLGGYAYVPGPPDTGTVTQQQLYRSDDAGASWVTLPLDPAEVAVAPSTLIDVVGIADDNPDHVYIRVSYDDNRVFHSIYRSTDRGASWQRIVRKNTPLDAFVVRAAVHDGHHDLIVGGQTFGAEISHDDGTTWTALAGAPHVGCLAENTAGELWACTSNFGSTSVLSDDAGIMKTADPEAGSWTKVLRFQDLTEAVTCEAGTIQQDKCASAWCGQCAQLGCTPSPSYACAAPVDAPTPVEPARASGGCCDSGTGGAGALALGLSVGMLLGRPRRRRAQPCR
jgi:photosystem II stability/assembly factor-like uncharacterized protein